MKTKSPRNPPSEVDFEKFDEFEAYKRVRKPLIWGRRSLLSKVAIIGNGDRGIRVLDLGKGKQW